MQATENWDALTFYIPYHNNYSQLENVASFIQKSKSKVFFYEWNTENKKMMMEFSGPNWPLVSVHTFTLDEIFNELIKDALASKKVVFLITASTNYIFGKEQLRLFQLYQSIFPSIIIDIAVLGHCMYGCDSCGVREHSIPIFFSRYINHQLPYTGAELKQRYFTSPTSRKILISPSVQSKSFLNRTEIITALVEIKKYSTPDVEFLVKLHGFCYIGNSQGEDGKPLAHPLHELSEIEIANLGLLRKNFRIVDEKHSNILPFLEISDAVVTDLDSSVAFESLYFSDSLQIVAFDWRTQEIWNDDDHKDYTQLLSLFKTVDELRTLIKTRKTSDENSKGKGKAFFERIYGQVTGDEISRMASLRRWFELSTSSTPSAEFLTTLKETDSAKTIEMSPLWQEFQKAMQEKYSDEGTPSVYRFLAHGLPEVPKDVAEYHEFISLHQGQLSRLQIPFTLWKLLWSKLKTEIFDAGTSFQFVQSDSDKKLHLVSSASSGLAKDSDIFLVDHAWTSLFENTKKQLREAPPLLERLEKLMDLEETGGETLARVDRVWNEMWKYNQCYRVQLDASSDEDTAVWYLMDEVGSRIEHCGTAEEGKESQSSVGIPNVRCVPFFYVQRGISYSLVWPIRKIKYGERVRRDFLADVPMADKVSRYAREYAYFWDDPEYLKGDASKYVAQRFDARLAEFRKQLQDISAKGKSASGSGESSSVSPPPRDAGEIAPPIKVWSNVETVVSHLKSPQFQLVSDDKIYEADVLWFAGDVKKNAELFSKVANSKRRDQQGICLMVNQLPDEECICQKQRLIETLHQYWGDSCHAWVPETYNLNTQLDIFIAHWRENEEKKKSGAEKENYWIAKPWNRSRGLEIFVSDAISPLIRSLETGPKIMSRYISSPALYGGRKFDLRYIVLVRSLDAGQLELYAYRMFWIRCANKPFGLTDFDDYEKHFTVMNYTGFNLQQIWFTQFITQFEKEHPGVNWEKDVQPRIYRMFRDTFLAAAEQIRAKAKFTLPGVEGDIPLSRCRAMYGLDVMLTDKLEPRLLEVNFAPDCHRAVNYDPEFFNVVFSVLYDTHWIRDVEEKHKILAKVAPL